MDGTSEADREVGTKRGLTDDEARAALERHVRDHFWLRRGIAGRLPLSGIKQTGAFHVVLESFTEARRTERASEPYRGGVVDGPENGLAPEPWRMEVPQPGLFTDEAQAFEIPHTDHVETCPRCDGRGDLRCTHCGGDGRVSHTKTVRSGSGKSSSTRTVHYTSRCKRCSGSGRVTCDECEGTRKLRSFEQLEVTWRNRVDEVVIEHTDLPDELIGDVEGLTQHSEEADRLEPTLAHGGGPFRGGAVRVSEEVDAAVDRLIEETFFPSDIKLHRQRMTVRAVPVWEVSYPWGREPRRFWVYGTDHKVHAPGFPLSPLRIAGVVLIVLALTSLAVAIRLSHP